MTTILQKAKTSENPGHADNDALSPHEAIVAQPVSVQIPATLPAERITGLLHAIGKNIPSRDGAPVVHFVSAYKQEGADLISLETAAAAARTGKRTLFIDTGTGAAPALKALRGKAVSPHHGEELHPPLLSIQGTTLFFTLLPDAHGTDGAPEARRAELLAALRRQFDLIVVYSDGALANPAALALFGLSDGCIVVAEAERTRIPVIKNLNKLIDTHGGRTIGAVLNKRKFHIPGFIYSLFFGS